MRNPWKVILPLAGAAVFLLAPGRADARRKAPFAGRNFAHRGLHTRDGAVPENSLPAFRAAADAGYGMELDVQLSADGRVVVFHDDTLDRVCGVSGFVYDRSWAQLRDLRLGATAERMPLLTEVFDAVAGREPIIIELKRGPRNAELCRKTLSLIDAYGGVVCVESFDPFIVRWFKRNAPELLRGQLSAPPSELGKSNGLAVSFALGNLLTNFLARPQFVAYQLAEKPLCVRLCEAMGAMKVAWTSHDPKAEAQNDAVIFEFYRPERRFR